MLTLSDYCTAESIRAVLGVSDDEIEDSTVEDPIYVVALAERLADMNSGIVSAFAAIGETPTTNEERFSDLVKTFAAYAVAQQMLASLKMFAPQVIMDSKSQMTRVADPYKDLRESIQGSLNYFKSRILALYVVLYPLASVATPVPRILALNAGLAFDPVTNT